MTVHNGEIIGPDYVLQDGDAIIISPRGVRAEVPMPSVRLFKKHLKKTFNMSLVTGTSAKGKGDHVKWQHSDGWSIDVNPSKRDRKEVEPLQKNSWVPAGCGNAPRL